MTRTLLLATLLPLMLAGLPARAQEAGPPPQPGAAAPGSAEALPADVEAPPSAVTEPGAGPGGDVVDDATDAGGDEDSPRAEPPEPVAPTPAGPLEPVPLAFLGLRGPGSHVELAFTLEESIRTEIAGAGAFTLTDAAGVVLEGSCLDDVSCRKDALAGVRVPWVLVGRVDVAEAQLGIHLWLVRQADGAVEAQGSLAQPVTADDDGRAGLLASLGPLVRSVLQTVDPSAPPAIPAELVAEAGKDDEEDLEFPVPEDDTRTRMWPEEEARKKAEDERRLSTAAAAPKPAAEGSAGVNYAAWIWSGGFLAAGASTALVGIAFDLISPTSVNDELDVFDAVGPGLVVIGATVALAGLVINPFLWLDTDEDAAEATDADG